MIKVLWYFPKQNHTVFYPKKRKKKELVNKRTTKNVKNANSYLPYKFETVLR